MFNFLIEEIEREFEHIAAVPSVFRSYLISPNQYQSNRKSFECRIGGFYPPSSSSSFEQGSLTPTSSTEARKSLKKPLTKKRVLCSSQNDLSKKETKHPCAIKSLQRRIVNREGTPVLDEIDDYYSAPESGYANDPKLRRRCVVVIEQSAEMRRGEIAYYNELLERQRTMLKKNALKKQMEKKQQMAKNTRVGEKNKEGHKSNVPANIIEHEHGVVNVSSQEALYLPVSLAKAVKDIIPEGLEKPEKPQTKESNSTHAITNDTADEVELSKEWTKQTGGLLTAAEFPEQAVILPALNTLDREQSTAEITAEIHKHEEENNQSKVTELSTELELLAGLADFLPPVNSPTHSGQLPVSQSLESLLDAQMDGPVVPSNNAKENGEADAPLLGSLLPLSLTQCESPEETIEKILKEAVGNVLEMGDVSQEDKLAETSIELNSMMNLEKVKEPIIKQNERDQHAKETLQVMNKSQLMENNSEPIELESRTEEAQITHGTNGNENNVTPGDVIKSTFNVGTDSLVSVNFLTVDENDKSTKLLPPKHAIPSPIRNLNDSECFETCIESHVLDDAASKPVNNPEINKKLSDDGKSSSNAFISPIFATKSLKIRVKRTNFQKQIAEWKIESVDHQNSSESAVIKLTESENKKPTEPVKSILKSPLKEDDNLARKVRFDESCEKYSNEKSGHSQKYPKTKFTRKLLEATNSRQITNTAAALEPSVDVRKSKKKKIKKLNENTLRAAETIIMFSNMSAELALAEPPTLEVTEKSQKKSQEKEDELNSLQNHTDTSLFAEMLESSIKERVLETAGILSTEATISITPPVSTTTPTIATVKPARLPKSTEPALSVPALESESAVEQYTADILPEYDEAAANSELLLDSTEALRSLSHKSKKIPKKTPTPPEPPDGKCKQDSNGYGVDEVADGTDVDDVHVFQEELLPIPSVNEHILDDLVNGRPPLGSGAPIRDEYMRIEATATVPANLFNDESRDVPTPIPTTQNNQNNETIADSSDHEVSSTQETFDMPTKRCHSRSNSTLDLNVNNGNNLNLSINKTSPSSKCLEPMDSLSLIGTAPLLLQNNQVDTTHHLPKNCSLAKRRMRKSSTHDGILQNEIAANAPFGKRRKTLCPEPNPESGLNGMTDVDNVGAVVDVVGSGNESAGNGGGTSPSTTTFAEEIVPSQVMRKRSTKNSKEHHHNKKKSKANHSSNDSKTKTDTPVINGDNPQQSLPVTIPIGKIKRTLSPSRTPTPPRNNTSHQAGIKPPSNNNKEKRSECDSPAEQKSVKQHKSTSSDKLQREKSSDGRYSKSSSSSISSSPPSSSKSVSSHRSSSHSSSFATFSNSDSSHTANTKTSGGSGGLLSHTTAQSATTIADPIKTKPPPTSSGNQVRKKHKHNN